jgi:hypothetical protein
VATLEALSGTPGTTGVPTCHGADEGDGDILMAYLIRLWGLVQAELSSSPKEDGALDFALSQLQTDGGTPLDRTRLRDIFAKRAWLQGGPADVDHTVCHILVDISETENHEWMIRTTRFLHNELLPIIPIVDPGSDAVNKYDINGNADNNSNGLTGILNAKINDVLAHDWIEYNSRPYSRFQMLGLLNLYDFATDSSIRNAAGKLLDFMAVKHASESANHLRIATFRRRAEYSNANLFQGLTTGPMYQVWTGGLDEPLFIPGERHPSNIGVTTEMVLAASSGYRPLPGLVDTMLNRNHRDYLEGFNGQGQVETAYGGPDFVITGGGNGTECPYPAPDGLQLLLNLLPFPTRFIIEFFADVNCPGNPAGGNDGGGAQPIALIPRHTRTSSGDTLGFPSSNNLIHIDPNGHSLTCIERNFACGPALSIPTQSFQRNDCKTGSDGGYSSSSPDGPIHHFEDVAFRFDEQCAGAAYAGHCFFVYGGTLDYSENWEYHPKFAYFVTHSCSPSATDTETGRAFQAFITYMRTIGHAGGSSGPCSYDHLALCLGLEMQLPPQTVDLTGVTTVGRNVAAHFDGRDEYDISYPRFPDGVMSGDLPLTGSSFPSTTTGLASSPYTFFQQPVTFVASVAATSPMNGAGGIVSFLDGTHVIGSAPVSNYNGTLQATLSTASLSVGTHNIIASYSGDATFVPSVSDVTYQTVFKAPTKLTYTGAGTGDYNDPATAGATLTSVVTNTPLSEASVDLTLDGQKPCSQQTNTAGQASCTITPNEPAGSYPVTAVFGGDANYQPSRAEVEFTVTKEETTLVYTGPTHIANGTPARLAAVLKEDGTSPIAGRTITLVLGTGSTQQPCTTATDSTGTAICTIASVNQPLTASATVPLTATFPGDPFYLPANASATLLLQYATGRAFGLSAAVRLLLLSLSLAPTPDTGPVRTASSTSTSTPCTATISTIVLTAHASCENVTTTLNPGTSKATSTIADATIGVPGIPVLKVSAVRATSTSSCGSATGSTTVTLSIGGVPTTVSTAPNTRINLAGAAQLIINEQKPVNGADFGLTVNAVHLIAAGGAVDIVIASSTTDAHNCA